MEDDHGPICQRDDSDGFPGFQDTGACSAPQSQGEVQAAHVMPPTTTGTPLVTDSTGAATVHRFSPELGAARWNRRKRSRSEHPIRLERTPPAPPI